MNNIRDIHAAIERLIRDESTPPRADMQLVEAQRHLELAARAMEPEQGRDEPPRDREERDPPKRLPERAWLPARYHGDGQHVSDYGDVVAIEDAIIEGRYRSCLMGNMGTTTRHRLDLVNVEFRSGPGVRGQDVVYGTAWAIRDYGVAGGLIQDADCHNFFSSKGEGHVTYLTLSLMDGQMLEYNRCRFSETGGHGIYHTWRPGNAPEPDGKGMVFIANTRLINTDIDPGRGAYAISLPDTNTSHRLLNVEVIQDKPGAYSKHGKFDFAGRGAIMAQGRMPAFTAGEGLVRVGKSDRYAQVWIEGPEVVTLYRYRFDCERISVNDPYGDSADTLKTKKLVLRDCVGPAELVWNGERLGTVDSVRSGEWTL